MSNKRINKGKSIIDFPADYVILDLETTGLSSSWDKIIEFGAIKVRNNEVIDTYSTLINPGFLIDQFIIDITGISNEDLENAPVIDNVIDDIISFIGEDILIGHNIVSFDSNFLYDSILSLRNKALTNDLIDTLRISRKLCKDINHHRLDDLIDYFSISVDERHRALGDCLITFDLFNYLKEKTILEYGSIDLFKDEYLVSYNKNKRRLNLKDLSCQVDSIDESNPFYKKVCVFTGTLEEMTREVAAQTVLNLGGIPANGVTKKTNYLILGNNDYCKSIKDGKSTKQKKAEEYIVKGQDLTIIPEEIFYEMINE